MKAEINLGFTYEQFLDAVRNLPQAYKKRLLKDLFNDKLETFISTVKKADLLMISDDEVLAESKMVRKEIHGFKKNKN